MKFIIIIILGLLTVSCSTTELVENWKNPDIDSYNPSKVLLVGMTSNVEARQQFEKQLQDEYASRGIESVMSLELFEPSFTTESEDYLKYQDVFYNPDYYEEYTVYHTETSMYCIWPTKERKLIWKGYIDVMDPASISETVNDYVRLIIVVLEEQKLINSIFIENSINEEAIK